MQDPVSREIRSKGTNLGIPIVCLRKANRDHLLTLNGHDWSLWNGRLDLDHHHFAPGLLTTALNNSGVGSNATADKLGEVHRPLYGQVVEGDKLPFNNAIFRGHGYPTRCAA